MDKKIKEMRANGLSLGEIANTLKIKRKDVEIVLAKKDVPIKKEIAAVPTSEKKATKKKPSKKGK